MESNASSNESTSTQTTSTLKVLIADDDAPTRILLRAAISQWGYQVLEAKDGEEAWNSMIQVDAPRLVILDWLMPKLDGITICEKSKKELNYRPYIILLTQVTGTTNIIKGLEAGADEFLSKPFNMAELRSRLSTGARIVQYELNLAERNKQLESYITHMQQLANNATRILQSLTLEGKNQQQVEDLRSQLQQINSLSEAFRTESKVSK